MTEPQYVYALTRADGADIGSVPSLDGVTPVALVLHGDLAAVTSPAPVAALSELEQRPEQLAVLARRHDAVVREVHRRAAVLPLRFGTVLTGPDAVHALLERTADRTRDRLDHVDGHAEWGVRVRTRPAPAAAAATTGGSGAAYLARRRDALAAAAATARTSTREADAVRHRLAERATDHVARPGPAGDDLVLDLSYLVPVADTADFTSRFADLAAHQALRLELTGPWPPYSFTTHPEGADG